MTNSTPEPGGLSAPDLSDGQQLLDGGSREADGEQWGPTKPPKTDAADDSGGSQKDPVAQPGRSVAAEDDPLAPQAGNDPTVTSAGRSEGASGGPGGPEQPTR